MDLEQILNRELPSRLKSAEATPDQGAVRSAV